MALARQSKYNLQQTTIGNEARFLHRWIKMQMEK
jgi:hypothetical protein